MPTKRVRDYKREEQRRNEIAVELGYSSRAALRGARKRGATLAARKAKELESDVGFMTPWTGGARLKPSDIAYMRKASKAWSAKHSRSPRSRFNQRWSDKNVIIYYQTFVNVTSPEESPYPVLGFGATADNIDNGLILSFFRDVLGLTSQTIVQYRYGSND